MAQIQNLGGRAFPAHPEKPVTMLCHVACNLSLRVPMGGLSGGLSLAIDLPDGSSDIDVNASIGTIFSIQPDKNARVATYHHLPAQDAFALISNRGFFRA